MYSEFTDSHDVPCSIQQSSAIGDTEDAMDRPGSSMIWLGVNDVRPKIRASQAKEYGVSTNQQTGWIPYPIPEGVCFNDRMHLSKNQVIKLINTLQYWVDSGELPT